MGNWAFSWVQIIAHNKLKLLGSLVVLSLIALLGLFKLDFELLVDDFGLMVVAILLMSVVVGYLLESLKIALLQLSMTLYVLCISLGLLGWGGYELKTEALLGIVVLMTLVSSNLVHVLSTLAREMARGLFQYDAIAESLKLNFSPIFLSNLTTALGFIASAFVEPEFSDLAWLVVLGVFTSIITILSFVPLILLSWLLEFRVGNTSDRHGLTKVASFLEMHANYRSLIVLGSIVGAVFLFSLQWNSLAILEEFFVLLIVFAILFWLAWKSTKLAALNLFTNLLALLLAVSLFLVVFKESEWTWMLWMIPLGLIVDDGIHFFSRFSRAKTGVFSDNVSAVTYAMASVGRPIWITSWVLLTGLTVLVFSNEVLILEASVLTIIALIITTFLILIVLPALLMTEKKR